MKDGANKKQANKKPCQGDSFACNHINNRSYLNDVETPIKIQRLSDWIKSNNYLYSAYKK